MLALVRPSLPLALREAAAGAARCQAQKEGPVDAVPHRHLLRVRRYEAVAAELPLQVLRSGLPAHVPVGSTSGCSEAAQFPRSSSLQMDEEDAGKYNTFHCCNQAPALARSMHRAELHQKVRAPFSDR